MSEPAFTLLDMIRALNVYLLWAEKCPSNWSVLRSTEPPPLPRSPSLLPQSFSFSLFLSFLPPQSPFSFSLSHSFSFPLPQSLSFYLIHSLSSPSLRPFLSPSLTPFFPPPSPPLPSLSLFPPPSVPSFFLPSSLPLLPLPQSFSPSVTLSPFLTPSHSHSHPSPLTMILSCILRAREICN